MTVAYISGLRRPAGVRHLAAHGDAPGLRVDHVGDEGDACRRRSRRGTRRRADIRRDAGLHVRRWRLVDLGQRPELGEVAHDEERRAGRDRGALR
ncbi:MAG: hypothetical protein MZV64_43295 [Ignavibacteriales bacterium]|nr:hypothetical protein [Ignavibacteriales bacterium]